MAVVSLAAAGRHKGTQLSRKLLHGAEYCPVRAFFGAATVDSVPRQDFPEDQQGQLLRLDIPSSAERYCDSFRRHQGILGTRKGDECGWQHGKICEAALC